MFHSRLFTLLATLLAFSAGTRHVEALDLAKLGHPVQLPPVTKLLEPVPEPSPEPMTDTIAPLPEPIKGTLPLPPPVLPIPRLPLPLPKLPLPRAGCSKIQGKIGTEVDVALLGSFQIEAPRTSSGRVVPFRIADCNDDGRADLSIPWSEGDAPIRLNMKGLCPGGTLPTEVRVLLVTDHAVVNAYGNGGVLVDQAVPGSNYVAQELKVIDAGGIHYVEIVGSQMCLLDVCWECPPEPQEPTGCFVLDVKPRERFGAIDIGGVVVTAAVDGVGGQVALIADDCDGDGDLDIFVPWSEAAGATQLAEIRFDAPCEEGVATSVSLDIGAFAHDVNLYAYDLSGVLTDSVTLAPSSSMQSVVLEAPAGLDRIKLDGAEICLGDICWECEEPEKPQLPEGCARVNAEAGKSRLSFEVGNALMVAATASSFTPRLLTDDCNGDGQTDIFIPWSEAGATTPATFYLANACGGGAVLRIEMVLRLGAGSVTLRSYDSDNRLVQTTTVPGSSTAELVSIEFLGGIDRIEFEGAEICIQAICWECGSPEDVEIEAGPRFQRGDPSGDGSVDISDALAGLKHLFAGAPLACPKAADTNDNGELEMVDSIQLLDYLFRGSRAPAAPFKSCGADPTGDQLDCETGVSCPD